MNTFKKKWNNKTIDDDGCYMSKEAKSFVTAFRNMLKRELPNYDVQISSGHYNLSGFITNIENGKVVYVSYSIPRYGAKIDFDLTGYATGVLYRTAKNTKDFTGGTNQFCNIKNLPMNIKKMLE